MRRAAILLALLPSIAAGDEVHLKSGGQIDGVVVDWNEAQVILDVGPGRIVLPTAAVKRVVHRSDPLARYAERARALERDDVEGWLALGLWARDSGLLTQATQALERVVAFDPDNALAQAALGRVRHAGNWLTPDERQRALGYVPFEGRWVTPAEHEAALRERRERDTERRARRREAAEARIRTAEHVAPPAPPTATGPGIPLGYVYGASAGHVGPYRSGRGHAVGPHRGQRGQLGLIRHRPARNAARTPARQPRSDRFSTAPPAPPRPLPAGWR